MVRAPFHPFDFSVARYPNIFLQSAEVMFEKSDSKPTTWEIRTKLA
jgi:hypothetical protein